MFPSSPISDSDSNSDSDSPVNICFRRFVRANLRPFLSFFTYPYTHDDAASLVDIHLPSIFDIPYFIVYGHIQGLFCISHSYDIFLWNPTTHEVHQLPPSIFPRLEPDDVWALESSPVTVGFGYDSKSKDFKVVRVMQYYQPLDSFYQLRVEIYYLSADKWREIDLTSVFNYDWNPSFEMYHDGFYYWRNVIEEKEYIQSFDMSTEVFQLIIVPKSFEDGHDSMYRSLGVWNGLIVMFHYPTIRDKKALDIWEMKRDKSDGVSWSKLLSIGIVSRINRPLLFVNSDELLMEVEGGQFVYYNVNTKLFKDIPVNGRRGNFRCFLFEKSMLSIKGFKHDHGADS